MDQCILDVCVFREQRHLIDFDGNINLHKLYKQIASRWDDELTIGDIVLKYYLIDKTHNLIVLKSDQDVANMYRIHMLNGVLQAKFVVKKKESSSQAPINSPQSPQIIYWTLGKT